MPVSIRDVAKQANVSVGTVSKVLNDVPSRIPPVTRDHIRRIAGEIGYQPNLIARSLGRRRTDTIGLMISGLQNPFFVDIAEAAERFLLEAGYQVFLDAAPSQRGTYQRHGKLRGWPVDGVLMWAEYRECITDYLGSSGAELPVVYLGYPRDKEPESYAVAFDLYDGGRKLTEHLIERGYGKGRSLMHIVPVATEKEGASRNSRLQASRDVCAAHGIRQEIVGLPGYEETREAGYLLGEQIVARPPSERPDAVFCHNDVVAVGLYRALRRAGLRVPQDVAVAGFDGIPEGLYLDDPLTTVETRGEEICRVAVDMLLSRLSGQDTHDQPRQVLLPTRLRVGGTT